MGDRCEEARANSAKRNIAIKISKAILAQDEWLKAFVGG